MSPRCQSLPAPSRSAPETGGRGGQAMMRLARRATLLVVFSLLTSAATAHAECAWVLWGRITTRNPDTDLWNILEAYESRNACERDRPATEQQLTKGAVELTRREHPDAKIAASVLCLPDTVVDPRGPKASGR